MAYQSLRDFITHLEREGRLRRVSEPVSTHLEMTEIQTRLLAEGGPAVLFEHPVDADGSPTNMPMLVNLFGTVERVAWGMGRQPAELRELGETLAFLRQPEPPGGLREAVSMLPLVKQAMTMRPKTVAKAPCQEVVWTGDDIDLARLPIQGCWPGEPAPLITWPLVVTKGPGDDKQDDFNVGIYRMQVTGPKTTLMRWLKHRGGMFYGQCSELCGTNHGFMPIQINVVSKDAFAKWLVKAKVEYAADEPSRGIPQKTETKVAVVRKN